LGKTAGQPIKPWHERVLLDAVDERRTSSQTVGRREGNEAKLDGSREVRAFRSTDEAGERTQKDPVEGRECQGTEPQEGKMKETPSSENISTRLERIAKLAKEAPQLAFTTLAHHIDLEWLLEAYRRTRKDGARGIDGQSAQEYARNLESNLQSLLERAKTGRYCAPAVRRVNIPKGDGTQTRPIGIPTFEDKVLQRTVAMVLEAIYEQDFLDCSYGFRPRRSAHQALEGLQNQAVRMAGGWVLELDIRKFFDTLDRGQLRRILRRRVRDGVVLRLIDKWLNAGVMENGEVVQVESGTPQGGVISPLLANIYLHEVLDVWFAEEVLPRLQGRAALFRYADDAVMLFSSEVDARRVLEVLPKRFGKYGLTLHPEKTKLVAFRRPDQQRDGEGDGTRGTFDLLGFTHHWGKSRSGKWVVKQRTSRERLGRAVERVAAWCRKNQHKSIDEQHGTLVQKLRGHYGYYGITGNYDALARFLYEVVCLWRKWLNRRSQKAKMGWEKMKRLLQRRPLPEPRVRRAVPITQRTWVLKSRMREICTSGSVGAPGV
jgi:group II intron reverse transcriptase/maturase